MAWVADRDHVLRYVELAPRRIPQVMRLRRWASRAALAHPVGPFEHLGANLQESGVAQVLAVGAIFGSGQNRPTSSPRSSDRVRNNSRFVSSNRAESLRNQLAATVRPTFANAVRTTFSVEARHFAASPTR